MAPTRRPAGSAGALARLSTLGTLARVLTGLNDMRMNKVYVGFRPGGPDSNEVNVSVVEDGDARELDGRLDLKSHSPSGFRWGSSGTGAAQLALAILADATGSDDYAARHHHWFKLEVVSVLPREAWKLTGGEVMAWTERHHPLGPRGQGGAGSTP